MAELTADVHVVIGAEELRAGRLWAHRSRGRESAAFAYDDAYLAAPEAYELDPALPLVAGRQQTPGGHATFGAFSDCAPDRWGRRLVKRAEEQRARRESATPRSYGEMDYLLGVRDDLRQGALRFRDPGAGAYLAEEDTGVPHLLQLPEFLGAAERVERDEANEEELRTLLRGGSSLGGARPKAHVLDQDGRIAIAKFPSPVNDEWDVMRWESVALRLAALAGIDVPSSRLHIIDRKPVLVVDRFDRADRRRIGYASAMTMLEVADGERGSYLDIADVIETRSTRVQDDLRQLWRRMAFSVLIRNTDDHLRNHGFLRASTAGWALSPAFDVNPDPSPGDKHLSTAIDYNATEARIDLVVDVAGFFRLDALQARTILAEVLDAVARWRAAAHDANVAAAEIDRMALAFEHRETERARALVAAA